MGFVAVNYEVSIHGPDLFFAGIHVHGGPAPVRRLLPDLIQRIWDRTIDPGKVFDLALPLDQAAEGYKAMDERRATKVLLTL
jgi:threonine dehydrogenase-like Zn-dependent dehydrogenase